MTHEDVLEALNALEQAGVSVWVDGGWGVDALVGVETRPHTDLDLALDRARPIAAADNRRDGAGSPVVRQ